MKPNTVSREICTADRPYSKGADYQWAHPDAVFQKEIYSGDGNYETYKCPHCGLEFDVTIAD